MSAIFMTFMTIYVTYRFILVCIVLKKYFKYKIGAALKLSSKTSEQFHLIFLATIIQTVTTMSFAAFLGLWLSTFFFPFMASSPVMKNGTQICIMLFSMYPIVDVFAVLVVVKVYRRAVTKIFARFRMDKRRISIFTSHSVQMFARSQSHQVTRRRSFEPHI